MKHARRLKRVLNVDEMRSRARRLPRPVFDLIDGGAGDEKTLRANREAFDRIWFRPRTLAKVEESDLSTTVLGQAVSMPILLAPCGYAAMAHRDGDLAVARAAAAAGTIQVVSTFASDSLEAIAQETTATRWYQLYMPGEREAAAELLARVQSAGYPVLCLTVDAPATSNRERDYRNRVTVPLRLSPSLLARGLMSPGWAADFLRGAVGRGGVGEIAALGRLAASISDSRSVSSEDIGWVRDRWRGPLVVKGVMRGDDCEELLALGVDGIVVSNHGGRQLDGVRATVEILPEVSDTVAGRAEVFIDGGIRRGIDVAKALALGARACLIGRPYLYGLAVGGQPGVQRVLEILGVELQKAMAQLGCGIVDDFEPSLIERR